MARWTASAKWAEGPALDGRRATLLAFRLSAGLGRRISECPKYSIDSCLIASSLRLEPSQDILINAQRDK